MELQHYSKHEPDSPLFVTKELRICVDCPEGENVHPLLDFTRTNSHKHCVMCRKCFDKRRELVKEEVETMAVATLTKEITRARKDNRSLSFVDVFHSVCEPLGGVESASKLSGRVLKKAMRQGLKKSAKTNEVDLAVKAASAMIRGANDADKRKDAGDFSQWTEEEAADICMEFIRENKSLRKRMLADVDIRQMLLKEAGIETIEVKKADIVEVQTTKRDEPL